MLALGLLAWLGLGLVPLYLRVWQLRKAAR